jgi:hypothetical protein
VTAGLLVVGENLRKVREGLDELAPVPFVPNVTAAFAAPLTRDPDCARMWGTLVAATYPDIAMTIPAMVAWHPNPIAVRARRSRNDFDRTGWGRPNADNDLGVRNAGREQDCSSGGE